MPAKAIWPSDSWPAQPVRTVSERRADREAEDRGVQQVPRRLGDDAAAGRRRRRARATQAEAVELADPPDLAQPLGDRSPPWREGEGLGLAAGPAGSGSRPRRRTAMRTQEVDEAGLVEVVEADDAPGRCRSRSPATNARGNDTIPAITAAARARTRVLGPRLSRFWAEPAWPARRTSDRVASPPAMRPHERWRRSFGLMPDRRARSGFSAEALTALPSVGAVEEPAEADGDERDDDEDRELRRRRPGRRRSRARRRSASGTGRRARRSRGSAVRMRQRQLGDADGGHQHDDPRARRTAGGSRSSR